MLSSDTMAADVKDSRIKGRAVSAGFSSSGGIPKTLKDRRAPDSPNHAVSDIEHSTAFPQNFQYSGYLDVRTKPEKPWKRRYFVVNNNFLLSAATPHAKKLDSVIALEGSNTKTTNKSSDMTFELFTHRHRLYFRAASPKQCSKWTTAIQRASKLKIKDIYRFDLH